MAQPEHAAALVRLARQDLDALVALSALPPIADAILGFHAQQAVEKGLKAWLASLGQDYPLTHNLPRLFTLLDRGGADVDRFRSLDALTPYAVQARYDEGDPDAEDALDRPAVVAEVTALLDHVASLLGDQET